MKATRSILFKSSRTREKNIYEDYVPTGMYVPGDMGSRFPLLSNSTRKVQLEIPTSCASGEVTSAGDLSNHTHILLYGNVIPMSTTVNLRRPSVSSEPSLVVPKRGLNSSVYTDESILPLPILTASIESPNECSDVSSTPPSLPDNAFDPEPIIYLSDPPQEEPICAGFPNEKMHGRLHKSYHIFTSVFWKNRKPNGILAKPSTSAPQPSGQNIREGNLNTESNPLQNVLNTATVTKLSSQAEERTFNTEAAYLLMAKNSSLAALESRRRGASLRGDKEFIGLRRPSPRTQRNRSLTEPTLPTRVWYTPNTTDLDAVLSENQTRKVSAKTNAATHPAAPRQQHLNRNRVFQVHDFINLRLDVHLAKLGFANEKEWVEPEPGPRSRGATDIASSGAPNFPKDQDQQKKVHDYLKVHTERTTRERKRAGSSSSYI